MGNTFNRLGRAALKVATISFMASTLLAACGGISEQQEDDKPNSKEETSTFSACIISEEDAAAIVRKFPRDEDRYRQYFSSFEFSRKRKCYTQHWIVPSRLKGMVTEGKAGSERVRVAFPYEARGNSQLGHVKGLEGKAIVARPIAPSLTFVDSNKFRKKTYSENTGNVFGKYEVWGYKDGNKNVALIDREGSDLYALITLKNANGIVSTRNADWIIVKSNLDDKYELSYALAPNQIEKIEEINSLIKARIRSYIENKGEH